MAKIGTDRVKGALSRTIMEEALEKYLRLLERLHEVIVSEDMPFQQDCNHFFRIRQKSEKFYAEYYGFMEEHKNNESLTFDTVLDHLYRKAGSIEGSFASKLLSMINPDMPVMDSRVLEILDIKRVRHTNPEKWIERNRIAYEEICTWYKDRFKSGKAAEWIKLFDEQYPDAKGKITDVKKIDLILWQIRD